MSSPAQSIDGSFEHLLAPGRIGSLALRNRILMCPMGDMLADPDGSISANQHAYFEARARGGAALLLVGSVSVAYPRGSFDERQVAASDDRYLAGLSDLTAAVHRHGGAIAAQLVHDGVMSLLDVASGQPMLVPSEPAAPAPDRLSGMVTPEELAALTWAYTRATTKVEYQVASEDDIAWVIERFADAADRCARAGFDGIELHAGHGYLLDEFLSPATNQRTDGWGGDVTDRARLLREVIGAVRARVGADFPLWMRINAVEHHKAHGERFEEQQEVIALAVGAGIDAVHVTAYASTDVATGPTDSYVPQVVGPLADYAAAVRSRVGVPVITFGRFEPEEADRVLAEGKADFVAMGRKLLADPDLPNKLAEGRIDDVRPCIYQYRCIGNIFVKQPLRCVVNAATGREHDLAPGPARTPRRVLVLGGGAAGLEVSRSLAERGHAVELWEAGDRLGGVLAVAAQVDPLLERYLRWLERQVAQAGVTVELGRSGSLATVASAEADRVLVATGARWGPPEVEGATLPHVHTVPSLGAWLAAPGHSEQVAVLGAGRAGLAVADAARRRGLAVTVLDENEVAGTELGLPGRWRLVHDLEAQGVTVALGTTVESIGPTVVRARRGPEILEIAADTVVVTNGESPDTTLADELRVAGVDARPLGDAEHLGGIEWANIRAAAVAASI